MRVVQAAIVAAIFGIIPSSAAAQTFLGLCAGTPDESASQCQALKAADARFTSATNKVPARRTYGVVGLTGDEIVAAICLGSASSNMATPQSIQPDDSPACEEWREAYADRKRAVASVLALREGTTPVPSPPSVAALTPPPQKDTGSPSPARAAPTQPAPSPAVSGYTLPVIRVAASEQIALVGQPMQLMGFVGHDAGPPRLKINGQPATLFETRAGDPAVARNSFAFRAPVSTEKTGTHIFVLEACESSGNCIGKEVVVRVVAKDGPTTRGKNYAFIVGNNDYKMLAKLKTAVSDANEVAKVLKARYAFDEANVRVLINADRAAILRELGQLRSKLTPDDRLLIYYAGHGQIDQGANEGFWQPVDAEPGADFTWISNGDLRRYLRGMGARHVLVVADSCFSGSLTRSSSDQSALPKDRFFSEIDSKFSRKVITSGGTEPVADSGSGNHSVFAHYFLKALRENTAPYITSFELFNGLVRAVTNNSTQKPEYGTIAQAGDEGAGDFTFVLKN